MEIVVRATFMFFIAWMVTRVVGKRGLSEMTPLDMTLLVTIGDLVQQGATQSDMSITGAFLAVATIALWVMTMDWVSYRWPRARKFIDGLPVLILRDGRPDNDVLHSEHLPLDKVLEQARTQGIADLSTVDYAVLEQNGSISFIRSSAF